jgi:hypothetical protein
LRRVVFKFQKPELIITSQKLATFLKHHQNNAAT